MNSGEHFAGALAAEEDRVRESEHVLAHVAWHGRAELIQWSETSSQGARIKLGIHDRNELTYFEQVTRRNRKRSGQRFRAVWQDEEAAPFDVMPEELWFAGATWSHTQGAQIVFWVTADDLEMVKGLKTRDQKLDPKESRGTVFYLALIELDQEERPVNQRQRDFVESLDRPKGGPISRHAGQLCNDPMFLSFVAHKRSCAASDVDSDVAAAWMRETVGIESRAYLDHDEDANDRYKRLVTGPFIEWINK